MSNKMKKIYFILLTVIVLLVLIAPNVLATISINGTNWYTKGQDGVTTMTEEHGINFGNVNGAFCLNHYYPFADSLSSNVTKFYSQNSEQVTGVSTVSGTNDFINKLNQKWGNFKDQAEAYALNSMYGNYSMFRVKSISSWNDSVTKVDGQTNPESKLQAAEDGLYSLIGNHKAMQNARWVLLGQSGNSNNAITNAAKDWLNWKGPQLKLETTNQTTTNIQYKEGETYYLVGPIKLNGNFESSGIDFTRNLKITVNANVDISGYKITEKTGKEIELSKSTVFYVKIPYNSKTEGLKKLDINASVDYLYYLSGSEKIYDLEGGYFKYDVAISESFGISGGSLIGIPKGGGGFTPDGEPITSTADTVKHQMGSYYGAASTAVSSFASEARGALGSGSYGTIGMTGTTFSANIVLGLSDTGNRYNIQDAAVISGDSDWKNVSTKISIDVKQNTMVLAGDVWEDGDLGKDSKHNGELDKEESMISGIEVRLYNKDNQLVYDMETSNPTLTDANGHYEFRGVKPNNKYYVKFTYDGITYTNTYGNTSEIYRNGNNTFSISNKDNGYNTEKWNKHSHGSEKISERADLNTKFVSIGSYPCTYKTNAVINGVTYLRNGYNTKLDDDTINIYKKKVTEKIEKLIKDNGTNLRLEGSKYITDVYQAIINETDESKKVEAAQSLQYIYDCRLSAYAGWNSIQDGVQNITVDGLPGDTAKHLYPYTNNYVLDENVTSTYPEVKDGVFAVIYNGQKHINLGLLVRPKTDISVQEILHKAVVSINGKDETYKYGAFTPKGTKVTAADVMVEQKVTKEDFTYNKESASLSSKASYPAGYAPIELYSTYRIIVTNNLGVPTSIDELATYIPTDYYSFSKEYTTSGGMNLKGVEAKIINKGSTEELDLTGTTMNESANSRYGTGSMLIPNKAQTKNLDTKGLYIQFNVENDPNKYLILEEGQKLVVYVTYRLGETSTFDAKYNCSRHAYEIFQDTLGNNEKLYIDTYVEINGYSTFKAKNSDVENTKNTYKDKYLYSNQISGALNSCNGKLYRALGTFNASGVAGNVDFYVDAEGNFRENDWDSATRFVLALPDGTQSRKIQGNVWETDKKAFEYLKDSSLYPEYIANNKIAGIKAELIEIKDGKEYIRAEAITNDSGEYTFTGIIPGEYFVRFVYGENNDVKSNITKVVMNGNEIEAPYNGSFFQSAKANPNTDKSQFWYAEETDKRYSDAYDEARNRYDINKSLTSYSYTEATNYISQAHIAYAYTSLIDVYEEYAKTETTANNPGYTIENIDFGLTPRTKSNVTLKKEVSHLRLVLQNGKTDFDVDYSTIKTQGVPGVGLMEIYGLDGKINPASSKITIQRSSELLNGATLEIVYKITVTNESEEDGMTLIYSSLDHNIDNLIGVALYKENKESLTYYENGIRTHKVTNIWQGNGIPTTYEVGESRITNLANVHEGTFEPTLAGPCEIIDFIPSNLNFVENNYNGMKVNDGWTRLNVSKEDIINSYYKDLNGQFGDVDTSDIYNAGSVVIANENNELIKSKAMAVGDSRSAEIVVSKIISTNNGKLPELQFMNTARITKIYNSDSRLQDMANAKADSTVVSVTVPTGIPQIITWIVIIGVATLIVAIGVFTIKKFVLTNK